MKHNKEWSLLAHVEHELEGLIFREYLEQRGFHPIFYSPSPYERMGAGMIFVLREEAKKAKELVEPLLGARADREEKIIF